MINDNQRREAAREIRQFLSVSQNERAWDHDGLQTVGRLVGTSAGENILARLADLIDPTCNIDVMTTGERADYECSEHIMRCLNCGAEFGYVLYGEDGDVSMDDEPNYCPQCGAEVKKVER